MGHPRFALDERAELVMALRGARPDSPTLCGEWTAAQLAAHLVLRERSLVEVLGRVPSDRVRAVAERHLLTYVAAHSYEQILAAVAAGPPRYSPFALPVLRENVNLLEYLIHCEDVRRAGLGWRPRELSPARQQAIWSKLRLAARVTLRSMPVAVRLRWPAHGEITVGRGAAVTASSDPVELALFAFGRQRVAAIEFDGAPADIDVVRAASIAV